MKWRANGDFESLLRPNDVCPITILLLYPHSTIALFPMSMIVLFVFIFMRNFSDNVDAWTEICEGSWESLEPTFQFLRDKGMKMRRGTTLVWSVQRVSGGVCVCVVTLRDLHYMDSERLIFFFFTFSRFEESSFVFMKESHILLGNLRSFISLTLLTCILG